MNPVKKNQALLWVLFMAWMVSLSCNQPTVIEYASDPIDVTGEPGQKPMTRGQAFTVKKGKDHFTIQPLAEYQISARVAGVKSYSGGWESALAPVDLTLVWGELGDPKMDRYISYRQHNRWYYYRYTSDCPVDNTTIINHSCNNHMIPSSDNIRRALKSIKKNDRVKIHGYLVNITGTAGNRNVWWNTSTTRSDSGDHSCEIIYVKKIRINNKIYY